MMSKKFYKSDVIEAEFDLLPLDKMLESAGLNESGAVQMFHTKNVLRRIKKYMPKVSGALIDLMTAKTVISKPEIVIPGPAGHFLYKGIVYVDPVTKAAGFMTADGWKSRKGVDKIPSDRKLSYNKEKNPQAGPEWDIRLVENESEAMTQDLQNYINRLAGRNK